jgi:hypothetical protein
MGIGNHASLHRIHLSAGKGIFAVAALVGVGRGAVQRVKRELAGRAMAVVTPGRSGTAMGPTGSI